MLTSKRPEKKNNGSEIKILIIFEWMNIFDIYVYTVLFLYCLFCIILMIWYDATLLTKAIIYYIY